MKKLMHISLVAVMLAAGLSTTALAAPEASTTSTSAVNITGKTVEVNKTYFTGNYSKTEASNFAISADNENIVGLYINAEEGADKIVIKNGTISLHERGTAISILGYAQAEIDGVVIWNKGNADGISASGDTNTIVKNSVIYGAQDPSTYKRVSPFALGLAGSIRVTNAVDNAVITYQDSIAVSGSWAALSTDHGSGVCLTADNVLAGIGSLEVAQAGKEYTATKTVNGVIYGFSLGDSTNYNSGYVSYCDSGFHNYYNNSQLFGTDYDLILSTGKASASVNNSYCYSDRIGVMWHKNAGGTVDVTDGSWYAKQCLFMMKCYSSSDTDGCNCNLIVDNTDLEVGSGGVLLQLMTSDDCGLNYEAIQVPEIEDDWSQVTCLLGTQVQKTYSEGFPPTTYYVFLLDGKEVNVSAGEYDAWVKANPNGKPVMIDYASEETSTAVFKNLEVEGDIYNAVWAAYQAVDVTFENASITGVISSSCANHVDADGNVLAGGTVIEADSTLDCHLGMGRVENTAAPTVNNPVKLTLTSNSTWNVTSTSYISKLVIDESSSIVATDGTVTMTVNGVETPIEAGTYEGEIVISVSGAKTITFADVTKSEWFCDSVYAAARAGLVVGESEDTYAPQGELTWAQTIALAVRVYEYNNGGVVTTDDAGGYQAYLNVALKHNIIDKEPADPNAAITRGDAAIIFAAVLGDYKTVNNVPAGHFTDIATGTEYYDAVYALAKAGICNGKGGNAFGVNDTFKRSEVAAIVARMCGLEDPAEL